MKGAHYLDTDHTKLLHTVSKHITIRSCMMLRPIGLSAKQLSRYATNMFGRLYIIKHE